MTTNPQPYQDTVIQKYIALIKSKTENFKVFYQGEPTRIGVSVLPCIMFSKQETRISPLNSAEDMHELMLRITVIVDIRSDLSTAENDAKLVEGLSRLYDLIEGRNADYSLKDESLLDILRSNLEVDIGNNLRTDLGSVTRVDYGETFQGRDPGEWRIEARIDFVANFLQVR